ncbi:MAG: tyrosine recombinase XerC [Oscillospiraceae bacterium]
MEQKKHDPYADAPPYISEYLRYLRVIKNRSEKTIEAYYRDLRIFLRYIRFTTEDLPENMSFSEIPIRDIPFDRVEKVTLAQVYDFLDFEALDCQNNERTRARKISALKGFYKALCNNKLQSYHSDNNPVEFAETPSIRKTKPKYLALDDSRKLLENVPDDASNDYIRDYCIITLFINCGMRLSELVGLNIGDIDFNDNTMRILGKGNKERILHINRACLDTINDYLAVRPESEEEPNALFLSKFGRRISRRRVQQIVENALKASNLDNRGLSVHKLRHTAATLMYQYGNVDPLVLKEVLGHQSTATTEIYTHLANENIRKALDSNPLADEAEEHKRKPAKQDK